MMVTLLDSDKYLKRFYSLDLFQIKVMSLALKALTKNIFSDINSILVGTNKKKQNKTKQKQKQKKNKKTKKQKNKKTKNFTRQAFSNPRYARNVCFSCLPSKPPE